MKKDRIGESNISFEGYEIKIINYNNAHDIVVEFQDNHKAKINSEYKAFKKGNIRNPYHPTVCGVGYIGNATTAINKKHKQSYVCWANMLKRCYSQDNPKYIYYKGCTVCEEWLCYENFEIWWNDNYYEISGEKMNLDKDILIKGNKIYSPNTCILVPARINTLFVFNKNVRGDLLIGVYYDQVHNKYVAHCKIGEKRKTIGYADSEEEAFLLYKEAKEQEIKRVAQLYKDIIPYKLYKAMMNYTIEKED